jgi:hypothetical protein
MEYQCKLDFSSVQQFAAAGVPLPVGGQYLLVQPGANPVLYVTRSDSDNKPQKPTDGGPFAGIVDSISNFIPNLPFVPQLPIPIPGFGPSETNKTDQEGPSEKPDKVITRGPNGCCMEPTVYITEYSNHRAYRIRWKNFKPNPL